MSTAKSMAASYLSGKRNSSMGSGGAAGISSLAPPAQHRAHFKSSASNLASPARPTSIEPQNASNNRQSRLKATSMTNLISSPAAEPGGEPASNQQGQSQQAAASRIRRPASRNALDSIHNGMNSKYAQVQSKVYLHNIRPAAGLQSSAAVGGSRSSLSPATKSATLQHPKVGSHAPPSRFGHQPQSTGAGGVKVPSDRTVLLTKLKNLQEANERAEEDRERLRLELDRERADKADQVQQLKLELQEKLAEHDKQNEEYHQKLLEAYELADQNRRAADSVLSESRQRDEEARKRIEELESQLAELKEFVAMKEEMTGKMFELREQIREERERYEGQLKSLHQVFENEKLSNKMDHNSSSSSYFKRIKPSLQSSESINKPQSGAKSKCRQCQSAATSSSSRPQLHQHHCSEQDIYGSKLSTRMQDTAKSAWKASKHFASSVITGGVNLSACRQCTKRAGAAGGAHKRRQQPQLGDEHSHNSNEAPMGFGATAAAAAAAGAVAASCAQQQREQLLRQQAQSFATTDDQHTSVIKLEAKPELMLASCSPQQSPKDRCKASSPSVAPRSTGGSVAESLADSCSPASSLIRVDENNKLTIVTKFSSHNNSDDSHQQQQAHSSVHSQAAISPSSETARSANGSERGSRCESSSSGRGTTASETGSATASQNGDTADQQRASAPMGEAATTTSSNGCLQTSFAAERSSSKQHRRKSSLFKASKVFGGSQVSLNKLRNFFSAASTASSKQQRMGAKGTVSSGDQQQHQREDANLGQQSSSAGRFCADNNNNNLGAEAASDHLESSRLRCMELNRAIKVASMAAPISVSEERAPIADRSETTTTTKSQAITTTVEDNISKVGERDDSFEASKLSREAAKGEEKVGQGGCVKVDCEDERADERALLDAEEAKEKRQQQQHVGDQLKFEMQPAKIGANSQSAALAAIESC